MRKLSSNMLEAAVNSIRRNKIDPLSRHSKLLYERVGNAVAAALHVGATELPPKVKAALEHVRCYYPNVTQVFFGRDGRWQYMTDDFYAPAFDARIDTGLLEDAQNEVEDYLPCAFGLDVPFQQ